jgi:PST family polysaccharide transporter
LFLFGGIIAIGIILFNNRYYQLKELFFVSFIFVFARAIMPIWYFLGMERMQGITIVSIISKFVYLISVWFFIKNREDIFNVVLYWSLAEFIPSIVALFYIIFKDSIIFENQNFYQIFDLLKRDFIFSLSLFFFRIYTYIPVLILGQVCNEYFVGIYSVADKIIAVIKDTIGLLFNSVLPRVSSLYIQSASFAKEYIIKVTSVFTVLYLFGILILNIFAIKVISFFTNQYIIEIRQILLVLSVSCLFILLRIPSSVFIVIKRLDTLFTISIAICTLSCIFTSYILANKYQVMGVSYAILFSEFLLFLLLFVSTLKKMKLELNDK